MPRLLAPLRRPLPSLLTFAAVLGLTFWVGCGKDDKNPMNPGGGATSSSFAGWLGNGNESGFLTLKVSMGNLAGRLPAPGAASVTATATGFLTHPGGATDTLNGTYDDETGYVDVVGGGYTLAGVYDPGPPSVMFGTYTGPNGSGDFHCEVAGPSGIDVYCGTFENDAQTSSGIFIVAVRGNVLEGAAIVSGSSNPTGFTGTVSGTGTIRTVDFSSTITGGYKLIGSGQIDTGTALIDGTYEIEYNTAPYDAGSWSGELVRGPIEVGTE